MVQDQKEQAQLLTPPTPQPVITPATEITLQSHSTSDSPSVDLDPYQMFVQAGSQLLNTMADMTAHYEGMRGHYVGMQKKIDGQKIDMEEQRRKMAENEEYCDGEYSDREDEFEQLQSQNRNLRM